MNTARSTATPNSSTQATVTPIVGATHDPMEQEAHRISEAIMRPSWSASSGGSISRDRPIEGPANTLPAPFTPQGTGRPLKAETREFMETRLGHDFSQVRIHDDAHASASAHAIQARAYTVGNRVVADRSAIHDERPEGFPVLAHELVHVIQQSSAAEGARFPIRRQDASEPSAGVSNSRFSDAEIAAYLAGLEGTGKIENRLNSDNKASAAVAKRMLDDLPLSVRILLIREMLSGYVSRDEQQSILTILQEASDVERERILEEIDPAELRRRLRGDRRNTLNLLLRDVVRGRSAPVGTEWRIAYGTRGAESLRQSDETLNVVSMVAEPASPAEANESPPAPIPIIAEPRALTGSGAPQTVASDVSHPRDMGGLGYLTFNIGGTILGANTDRAAPYAPVTRDHHRITAHLSVAFESKERGNRTLRLGANTSNSKTDSTGDTDTSRLETVASGSAGRSDTDTAALEGARTQTREANAGIQIQKSDGTEITDESGTRRAVDLGGTLSSELRADAGVRAGATVSGKLLGSLLVLTGPEGIALYEALNFLGVLDDNSLTLGLDGKGGFTLLGEMRGNVAVEWTKRHSVTTTDDRSSAVQLGGSLTNEDAISGRLEHEGTTNLNVGGSVSASGAHTHSTNSATTNATDVKTELDVTDITLVPEISEANLEIRVE